MLDGNIFFIPPPSKSSDCSFSTGGNAKGGLRIFATVFGSSYKTSFLVADFNPFVCVIE